MYPIYSTPPPSNKCYSTPLSCMLEHLLLRGSCQPITVQHSVLSCYLIGQYHRSQSQPAVTRESGGKRGGDGL